MLSKKLAELCNLHQKLISDHLHYPQERPETHTPFLSSSKPQLLATTHLLSVCTHLPSLNISLKGIAVCVHRIFYGLRLYFIVDEDHEAERDAADTQQLGRGVERWDHTHGASSPAVPGG